jgi:hypothetical protein
MKDVHKRIETNSLMQKKTKFVRNYIKQLQNLIYQQPAAR